MKICQFCGVSVDEGERFCNMTCALKPRKVRSNDETLIEQREKTHGSFETRANTEQAIIDILQGSQNWSKMIPREKSGLRSVAMKLSRILCGDHSVQDHWEDAANYLLLGGDVEK